MRERQEARTSTQLDSFSGRPGRHRVPTVHRYSGLGTVAYFYDNDRRSWHYTNYISASELANSFAIIAISAGAFGVGIGQLAYKVFGG